MPSDALMELSTWAITGESGDQQYGEKTDYGMFEIFDFDFDLSPPDSDDKKDSSNSKTGDTRTIGRESSKHKQSGSPGRKERNSFTIKKSLDYASPDLFWHCCNNEVVIAWGIIIFRESGEDPGSSRSPRPKTPYLRLEFRNLQVTSFKWDLDPAAAADEASKVESVTFKFETILVQYSQQLPTGLHKPGPYTRSWNFAHPKEDVQPIGPGDTVEYTNPPT